MRTALRLADELAGHLAGRGIGHRLVEASGHEGAEACAVGLRTPAQWRLAVIPAGARLDLGKARAATGHDGLRLAGRDELRERFGELAGGPGGLPLLGPHYPSPELLDWRLLRHDQIATPAGDGVHLLLLDSRSLISIARPTVADLCRGR